MKKTKTIRIVVLLFAVLPVAFSACLKDRCRGTHTYTWYTPVYNSKDQVRANIKSSAPVGISNTGKIYIYGNYIFLNEVDKGIHVIDNSNPAQPRNIGFINIPGNLDIAVKDNMLYADLYTDLVTLDISNPANVSVKKIIEGVFSERVFGNGFFPDNSRVIVDWVRHDSTVKEDCGQSFQPPVPTGGGLFFANAAAGGDQSSSPVGIGGSMARFTIVNNYMYGVERHMLRVVSISTPSNPQLVNDMFAGFDIETIYPFKDKLFIGSQIGMFIYDISNPAAPVKQGEFVHARACDPVVADENYAYVTLREGKNCGPTANELHVVNIQNLQLPSLLKTYPMTGPAGLAKDNKLLFICDGASGLKVYDATNVQDLQLIKKISGIEPVDVIAYNNRALVVATNGIYQYDYSNPANIYLLSKLTIQK